MKRVEKKMKKSWNDKAVVNAYHWVDSTEGIWEKEAYYERGKQEAERYFLNFLLNSGKSKTDIKKMKALDIGCGTGRLVRGLAPFFESVEGIDISQEMIQKAKSDNKGIGNILFSLGNGVNLGEDKDSFFDFVYSFIVFQHIPSRVVIRNYFREVFRVLKEDGNFKVQVRGYPGGMPIKLSEWNYYGFDSFYIGLTRKKGIPFPLVRAYDTVYGAFFKKHELQKIVEGMGFKDVKIEQERENQRYLWVSAKKQK